MATPFYIFYLFIKSRYYIIIIIKDKNDVLYKLSPAETLKEPGQQEQKKPKKSFFARLFGKK